MKIQNENGRTMLEMLGVISIMGIITYGAIAGINYGMTAYKINQMYNEVQEIVEGIEDLYSWSKRYPTGNKIMEAAADNDIFSDDNLSSCAGGSGQKCIQGAYSDVYVGAAGSCDTDGCSNFEIRYFAIPADDCGRISQLDWDSLSVDYKISFKSSEPSKNCPGVNDSDVKSVTFIFQPK